MFKNALLFLATLLFTSCGHIGHEKLKVAATSVPHAEMLEQVKGDLENQEIDLEIIIIDDYNLPNRYLNDGEIDANFFQHRPFLQEQMDQFGYKIEPMAKIHLEPMGLYSKKYNSIKELPDGATIAIPNDPTNESRALRLLQLSNLISVDPRYAFKATVANIVNNPQHFKFLEIDPPMLPRALCDVDAAIIPSNFALQAGLDPLNGPLIKEQKDSPYANILVIREGDEDRADLQALKEALTSDKMRTFILSKYKGAIIPSF